MPIPIGEAAWNNPKKKKVPQKIAGIATRTAINKAHAIVHSVEHENVGVKAAHRAELMGESAYRSSKRTAQKAYRFHKNRPYRKAFNLEVKSLKTEAKLNYHKALQNAPKKKNAVSRYFHKRRIKRKYAASWRKAKKSGKTAKKSVGFMGKAGKFTTGIIRRNPIFLAKAAILGMFIILVMGIFSMCMSMFSGGSGIVASVVYVADYDDITEASVLYTELETDLQVYLRNIEQNHPGYDEYRFDVGMIDHNPFELMAFLTAVYGEFTSAEVEPTIRQIFAEQYQLSIVSEVEIRTRRRVAADNEGHDPIYEEYEWRILNVTLTSVPMTLPLFNRMDYEQWQHYNVLMMSHGARQFVGNPFDFNWLPHFSSRYGYRIHPIHGDKRFHAGIDIGLPQGTPILAGFDGTVTQVSYDPDGYGNFVVIDNGEGIQALYAHCHTVLVSVGASVVEGQAIATVGNTGASTGPHLHMEVFRNGKRLNPLFFVISGYDGGSFDYGSHPPLTPEQFAILYAEARSHLGTPYVFGANGPHAFDCSSFVCWVFTHSGIYHLPRTTAQGIFNQSIPIPKGALMPGDIVFFHSTFSSPNTVTHVGIYLGSGQMIHAGRPVNITSIHTPFWTAHWYAAGRFRW